MKRKIKSTAKKKTIPYGSLGPKKPKPKKSTSKKRGVGKTTSKRKKWNGGKSWAKKMIHKKRN